MPSPESSIKLPKPLQDLLRCPKCSGTLQPDAGFLNCTRRDCGGRFPVLDGVPVLLNEAASLFSIDDFASRRSTYFAPPVGKTKKLLDQLLPKLSKAFKLERNYKQVGNLLLTLSDTPRLLVLGGSALGPGMEFLVENRAIELVETDVALGPRARVICDAHNIPFEDASFDGVLAQAVLEHVVDPSRCVEEIHRVLKAGGIVYAETPFMQQVHGGRYDFTRFTHLGHRRLFRAFEEVESGAAAGPGVALAWSLQYFLFSFTRVRAVQRVLALFSRLAFFWLKYFDYYLLDGPGALDAASSYYFLGRKSNRMLSDRELVTLYRGANYRGGNR